MTLGDISIHIIPVDINIFASHCNICFQVNHIYQEEYLCTDICRNRNVHMDAKYIT